MKCPTCKDATLVMSERKGIEIDYCPECRGVWLDRGELDKIIEKSAEAPPAEQMQAQPQGQTYNQGPQNNSNNLGNYGHQQQQHQQNGQYYQKPYKRKKSFIEELFD